MKEPPPLTHSSSEGANSRSGSPGIRPRAGRRFLNDADGHDRNSNRKWRENDPTSGKDEYFTYDRLNRLTSMDRGDLTGTYPNYTGISGTPAAERDYTLHALGNWTDYIEKSSGSTTLDQDRTHNSVNEITGISEGGGEVPWIDPAWDARGNMTTVPKPSNLALAGGFTCAYDSWNRLAEVKQGQTVVAKYEYDGLNRRVKKHIDTQSPADPNGVDVYQHFFYNVEWQVLETREADSVDTAPDTLQPEYQFVWSQRYIDAPVLRDKNTDEDDLCDDETLYYLTDAQMNVTALVDTGGDAVERYVYDPYGKVTIYDDDWSETRSVSSYANPILFAGYYRDDETHLYHVRNRMYHPSLGRWLQRDPLLYVDGMNLYEYVRSAPINEVDPNGTGVFCWAKCIFKCWSCSDTFKKALKCAEKARDRFRDCRNKACDAEEFLECYVQYKKDQKDCFKKGAGAAGNCAKCYLCVAKCIATLASPH